MKKITILILVGMILTLSSQTIFKNSYLKSQNILNSYRFVSNKYSDDPWINSMIVDYFFTRNPHFSESFRNWGIPQMLYILDPNYDDSVTTGYYYDTFGPGGLNVSNSSNFILWKWVKESTTAEVILKTGNVLRHNFGGTITVQNNIPSTSTFIAESYYFMSSTDGFTGVTTWSLDYNTNAGVFEGSELCNLQFPNCTGAIQFWRMYFDGQWPQNMDFSACTSSLRCGLNSLGGDGFYGYFNTPCGGLLQIDFGENHFSGVTNYSFISKNILLVAFDGSDFTEYYIDELLYELWLYFDSNTPIKNLNVNVQGGNNSPPSSTGLNYISLLQTIYTNAGFTINVNTN